MEKKNKSEDNLLKKISGGYAFGKEKYSINEYNLAGVTFRKNIFSKDEYYYLGEKISQKEAEAVVWVYFFNLKHGKNILKDD